MMNRLEEKVNEILRSNRDFENSAGFPDPSSREVIRDFSHFQEIVESTLRAVSALDKHVIKHDKKCFESEFIIQSAIAFNLRFYDGLSTYIDKISLFDNDPNADRDEKLLFLLLWKQSVFSMISAYMLAKESLYYQAMQLIRGYIESSAVLYMSCLDNEFFRTYSSNDLSTEDYMKLWFKELKPSRILNKIQNIHSEMRRIDEAAGVRYLGGLRELPPEIFENLKSLYEATSDYLHFRSAALHSSASGDQSGNYYIGLKEGSLKQQQLGIFTLMATLFPHLTDLMANIATCRGGWHVYAQNKMLFDFISIQSGLGLIPYTSGEV